MKRITVITPANIEVEYRLAGAGSRLAAFTVDFLLQTVVCLMLAAIVLFGLLGLRLSTLGDAGGFALAFLIIAVFTIYFGYFIVCELTMNGQSIGKKIFGLRVIRDNGQPVGLTQSLVRNLFRIALDMLYIGLFVILFSKKHKRIGDIAAGTVVVSEHYEDSAAPLSHLFQSNTNYTPFKHINLTDDELYLLNQYLNRKGSLPDEGKALSRQFADYFAAKWNVDKKLINEAVLERLADTFK